MAPQGNPEHVWVGRCGCYSDIATPSRKPWFWTPQWYWFGLKTLLPISFGGDEYCRRTIVFGYTITGRMIVPLWGHSEKKCGDCPMIDQNTGGTFLDTYLIMSKELADEQEASKVLKARAKNIRSLSKKN